MVRSRLLCVLPVSCLCACAHGVDRFATGRLIERASTVGDVGEACAMGASVARLVGAWGREGHPPRQALVIAEATAALCAEERAWEADLLDAKLRARPRPADPAWAIEVKDARIVAARWHAEAAARDLRAWEHLEAALGPVGDTCPRLSDQEEFVWLFGLFAGLDGLLHDRAAGGVVGFPLDLPARVARAATCLDDADWWYVPGAFQAAAWAVVPGSGPADVDPWSRLEEQAVRGEATGVRLARALQGMIARNAGREEDVARGVRAHAASLAATPGDPDQALLDEYARRVSRYLSDLQWMEVRGYRSPAFGESPWDPTLAPTLPDVDPFLSSPESTIP